MKVKLQLHHQFLRMKTYKREINKTVISFNITIGGNLIKYLGYYPSVLLKEIYFILILLNIQ